jgi:CheY-like chemotaxis protein
VCHVLIIEDDVLIALHIQSLLEEIGATSFQLAATETQAVLAALSKPPGLMTSDINLREGSGLDAVEMIHEHIGLVPVIFITAAPEKVRLTGPHVRVLCKPAPEVSIRQAFADMRPEPRC